MVVHGYLPSGPGWAQRLAAKGLSEDVAAKQMALEVLAAVGGPPEASKEALKGYAQGAKRLFLTSAMQEWCEPHGVNGGGPLWPRGGCGGKRGPPWTTTPPACRGLLSALRACEAGDRAGPGARKCSYMASRGSKTVASDALEAILASSKALRCEFRG